MDNYQVLKNRLIEINQTILSLVDQTRNIPGIAEQNRIQWENTLHSIDQQLSEELVRVAVIGTIKSGKSSFTNSLFHGDYLKRGAGVVTSIVTRIRTADKKSATLFMKPKEQINREISQALVLFPDNQWHTADGKFDISHSEDRQMLAEVLENMGIDQRIDRDSRNLNTIILESYLKGYDRVCHMIDDLPTTQTFAEDQFKEHHQFVGDQELAVYVKDIEIQLHAESDIFGHIEIADCQGSDSPNPMHMAMIQDYLMKAHLLIYVISSRTGIRQADIRFLSMIQKMGIMDHVLFVLNCDLTEHENLGDLQQVIEKVSDDISLLCPNPNIFSFSALMNLFEDLQDSLSSRDRHRLDQWRAEEELMKISQKETHRFNTVLNQRLTDHRLKLLLSSNIERQVQIVRSIYDLTCIHLNLLDKDQVEIDKIIQDIQKQQQNMSQAGESVKNTLDGAIQKMLQKLAQDVDRFFDRQYGQLMIDLQQYIHQYTVDPQKYENQLSDSAFSKALYCMFQDFKSDLDFFMTEEINPRLHRFVIDVEKNIQSFLMDIRRSYDILIQDAIRDYVTVLKTFGIVIHDTSKSQIDDIDLEIIKTSDQLAVPSLLVSMHYSTRIRTEAVLNLGTMGAMQWIKKIFKQKVTPKEYEINALKKSIRPIKRELIQSINDHFKDVQENLKYQYLFKLLKSSAKALYDKMMDRFHAQATDLSQMASLAGKDRTERDHTLRLIQQLQKEASELIERISQERKAMTM